MRLIQRLRAAGDREDGRPYSDMHKAADEIERLMLENWQLKGALGYPVPGDIPEGGFKCGLCDARRRDQNPDNV